MKTIKQVGILINSGKAEAIAVAAQVVQQLQAHHVKAITLPEEGISFGASVVAPEDFGRSIDLLISIGGDGTFLRSARFAYADEVPILGINQGHLGFLTEIGAEEFADFLTPLLTGDYQLEKRGMIVADIFRAGQMVKQLFGLNDIVVTKSALDQTINCEVSLNQEVVDRYLGDGVIFSTATGSTGYSLSAGGPIAYPGSDIMIVTPISSHSLSARPIVFPAQTNLTVRLGLASEDAALIADGQVNFILAHGDHIQIYGGRVFATLVRLKEQQFFTIVRDKLIGHNENKYE